MGRVPSYRLHKATGQAAVTICGRDHYLGKHGSQAGPHPMLWMVNYRQEAKRLAEGAFCRYPTKIA